MRAEVSSALTTSCPPLLLASGSRYRRELLARLGLPFDWQATEVDETPRAGEAPARLARRLARDKARALSAAHPARLVIGSDQVAELDGAALGKPGTRAAAIAQLSACSGRRVLFHTAVAVERVEPRLRCVHCERVEVRFRVLDAASIERYVDLERPLDCAGSFRCEGLGIVLFESIRSRDPSALIGLPLITLARMLRSAGVDPLGPT